MKNTIKILAVFTLLATTVLSYSCSGDEPVLEQPESLIDFKDGIYTEYYPGRKAIKFKGGKDENNQRHGIWYFYAENGVEQSMSEYKHGVLNGSSFNRYPNGRMRYYGEYKDGKQVGIWVLYNEDGTPESETDFGTGEQQ